MNARTIRRAYERKARKQARKELRTTATGTLPHSTVIATPEPLPAAVATAQVLANRENAKLSTGPVTPEGKARSSRNALKTGLTGRTVILPGDDAILYERHLQSIFDAHRPEGEQETALVQSIADAQWRLARIPTLESGIYALGQLQFAAEFANCDDPTEAAILIQAKTFLAYQKQLNNLSIQESRLRRQADKDRSRLADLQRNRLAAAAAASKERTELSADHDGMHPINENGFEFSRDQTNKAAASDREPPEGRKTRLHAA